MSDLESSGRFYCSSVRFSTSAFSCANFFGSLIILAFGNSSFQDNCRPRRDGVSPSRHMRLIGLWVAMFFSIPPDRSLTTKKGGLFGFVNRGYTKRMPKGD